MHSRRGSKQQYRWLALACLMFVTLGLPVVQSSPAAAISFGGGPAVAANGGPTTGATGMEGLIPVAPARVLETRVREPGDTGRGRIASFGAMSVNATSALGVAPAVVAGVSLNVTVVAPFFAGYLTVWPGGDRPVASTINFVSGQVVANGAIVGVDATGNVSVFNGSGSPIDVIVDVDGWLAKGAGYVPISPVRALETRPGEPGYVGNTAFGSGETRSIAVTSRIPSPVGTITAVTVNLTAIGPTAPGYLTAFPTGAGRPATSSVNFGPGQVVPNSAVLGVTNGSVDIFNFNGRTDVVLDVTGYFTANQSFRGLAPQRLVDTREPGFQGLYEQPGCAKPDKFTPHAGPLQADRCYFIRVDEKAGLPFGFVGTAALNLTVAGSTASGYVTAFPSSSPRPTASSVNFTPTSVVANTVVVGADGLSFVSFYNHTGTTQLIVDITGWFPQDSLGLLSDGRQMRRYSRGVDHIGVVYCAKVPGSPADAANHDAALAKLRSDGKAYYEWLSGGRYSPEYVDAGVGQAVVTASGFAEFDCTPGGGWPAGLDGVLKIVPDPTSGAYGVAGPGFPCDDVDCTLDSGYPANDRAAYFTLNSLVRESPSSKLYFVVASHEFGHTLDWPHSYTGATLGSTGCFGRDSDQVCEYDNPLDIMSRPATTTSGTTPEANVEHPQSTIAFNRYAAGWITPNHVALHATAGTTYHMVAKGGPTTELVIVPTSSPAAFLTLDVRAHSAPWDATMTTYEGQLVKEGVEVMRVDQRADVNCDFANSVYQRCTGLGRRQQQVKNPLDYSHVVGSGEALSVDGVTVSVVKTGEGTYDVTVGGAPSAAFAPVQNTVVHGTFIDLAASAGVGTTFVCGVSATSAHRLDRAAGVDQSSYEAMAFIADLPR